jgi:hypothetical protein
MLAGGQCVSYGLGALCRGVLTVIARVMSGNVTKKRVTMILLGYHTIPQRVWMDQVEWRFVRGGELSHAECQSRVSEIEGNAREAAGRHEVPREERRVDPGAPYNALLYLQMPMTGKRIWMRV